MRHSYPTATLNAGVPVKGLSQPLGHADVGVTLRISAHVMPADDEAASDLAADAIFGPSGWSVLPERILAAPAVGDSTSTEPTTVRGHKRATRTHIRSVGRTREGSCTAPDWTPSAGSPVANCDGAASCSEFFVIIL